MLGEGKSLRAALAENAGEPVAERAFRGLRRIAGGLPELAVERGDRRPEARQIELE